MTEYGVCLYCDEPIQAGDLLPVPMATLTGPRFGHRECALREVMGGIGHHIAHDWWCVRQHDPDAGLSRRVSAVLVWTMYKLIGDQMVVRSDAFAPADAEVSAAGYSRSSDDDEWEWAVVRWAESSEPPEEPPPDFR